MGGSQPKSEATVFDSRRKSTSSVASMLLVTSMVMVILCAGCTRKDYRLWADRDAYRLLKTRQSDPLWDIPERRVEPDPRSRLADGFDPDCSPVPTDDPSAQGYMRHPFRSKPVTYWDERGDAGEVDQQTWLEHLPYDEDGKVQLTQQVSVDLALMHSRDFQDQVESLYTQALSLSQNRFEFSLNWFGGSDSSFSANDDGFDAQRNLNISPNVGFSRNLASGGQVAANLANSFVWQLGGGPNQNFGAGNLLLSITQPLLRGAFQQVRTESLTQSERSLLYSVRDFARFRRQFYLNTVSQYLQLLNQSQGIRIEEENLRNLRLNYEEHQELLNRGLVSPIQVDQVFQSYQNGRLSVINTKQSLEASLDQFKFQLGLPAKVPVEIDNSMLQAFRLNSGELEALREDAEKLENALIEYLPPEKAPREFFERSYASLESMLDRVDEIKPQVESELDDWLKRLEATKPDANTDENERIEHQQQSSYALRLREVFNELDEFLAGTREEIAAAKTALDKNAENETQEETEEQKLDKRVQDALEPNPESPEEVAWKRLQESVNRRLRDVIGTLFVSQTQIRLFAIEIKPVDLEPETAVQIALQNRLDLKNARAQVVDSFRTVEIAANQLQSDLNVSASANLQSDATRDNPLRFDGDENQYQLGVQFDGPLNRFSERNAYRASQISYQQQRRAYMATEDSIVIDIRQDMRQLLNNKFDFQISRQQLIAATRQVDEAQLNLRAGGGQGGGDSSLTQDLLNALNVLRNAQNSVISSWVSYEISRIRLFVDLELLMLDENGIWINEQSQELFSARSVQPDVNQLKFEQIINSDDSQPNSNDETRIRKPEPPEPEDPNTAVTDGEQDGTASIIDYFKPARYRGDWYLGDR